MSANFVHTMSTLASGLLFANFPNNLINGIITRRLCCVQHGKHGRVTHSDRDIKHSVHGQKHQIVIPRAQLSEKNVRKKTIVHDGHERDERAHARDEDESEWKKSGRVEGRAGRVHCREMREWQVEK